MLQKFPTTSEGIEEASRYIISQIDRRYIFDYSKYPNQVTAIFMAGAPGSGKTEFIESVLSYLDFFFIDIDSYRSLFSGYHGDNAGEYQEAMSKVVNKVFTYCLENNIRFILDGTFKSGMHSLGNIRECKRHNRKVEIYYLYQNPYKSYLYTFLREIKNERNIDVTGFVECFYKSIKNIYIAHGKFREIISLYICEKDIGPPLTKKNYLIHDTTTLGNIEKFCNKFNINYNSATKNFPNQERLENSLNKDRRLFLGIKPILRFYYLIKRKIGQRR